MEHSDELARAAARERCTGPHGAATASEGGLANTGYLAIDRFTIVQQDAPRAPATWPHQVGLIPPRALSFQHRAEADELQAAVDSGGTAVLSQVLTGTGGVGKTQLAADYARTAWDSGEVDVLLWTNARRPPRPAPCGAVRAASRPARRRSGPGVSTR